jgi:hypothetical protein
VADKQLVKEAALHIAASPQGKVVIDYFNQLRANDVQALVSNDNPDQVRRLQGQVRAVDQILNLFKP